MTKMNGCIELKPWRPTSTSKQGLTQHLLVVDDGQVSQHACLSSIKDDLDHFFTKATLCHWLEGVRTRSVNIGVGLLAVVLFSTGCSMREDYAETRSPSPLFAGFSSYQSIQEATNLLAKQCTKWETKEYLSSNTVAPPHDFVFVFAEHFSLSNNTGDIVLYFFNNRLQRIIFFPDAPDLFINEVEHSLGQSLKEGIKFRIRPNTVIWTGVVGVGGSIHSGRKFVAWEDTRLRAQEDKWYRKYGTD